MTSDALHAQQYGSGPAKLIGLHGWNGSHETFLALSQQPGARPLVAFDLPGFGRSAPPGTVELETVVGPVAAYLEERDLRELTLIGSCAGSVWAMELALRLKDRVTRLVLVDPFAYVPWYFALLTWPVLGYLFYWFSFAQPVGRWLTNRALEDKRAETTDLTADFSQVRHDVAHAYLKLLCRSRPLQSYVPLADLTIDILVGQNSFAAVHTSAGMFREIWPGASVHVIEGAGHLPIEEATDAVARIVFSASDGA